MSSHDIHRSAAAAAHLIVDGIRHYQPPYARRPDLALSWPRTAESFLIAWAKREMVRLSPHWYNIGRYEVECAAWDREHSQLHANPIIVEPRDSLIARERIWMRDSTDSIDESLIQMAVEIALRWPRP